MIFCCCDVISHFCQFCKELGWHFSSSRSHLAFHCKTRSSPKHGIYILRFLLITEVIKSSNTVKKKINVKIFVFLINEAKIEHICILNKKDM